MKNIIVTLVTVVLVAAMAFGFKGYVEAKAEEQKWETFLNEMKEAIKEDEAVTEATWSSDESIADYSITVNDLCVSAIGIHADREKNSVDVCVAYRFGEADIQTYTISEVIEMLEEGGEEV